MSKFYFTNSFLIKIRLNLLDSFAYPPELILIYYIAFFHGFFFIIFLIFLCRILQLYSNLSPNNKRGRVQGQLNRVYHLKHKICLNNSITKLKLLKPVSIPFYY